MSLLPRRVRSTPTNGGSPVTVAWTWLGRAHVKDPFLWEAIRPYQQHQPAEVTVDRCPIRDCRYPTGENGLVCDRHYIRLPKILRRAVAEHDSQGRRLEREMLVRNCELQFYTHRGARREPPHEHEVIAARYSRSSPITFECSTCGATYPGERMASLARLIDLELAAGLNQDRLGTLAERVEDDWNCELPVLRLP